MEFERLDDYQSWCIRCGTQKFIIDPWLMDDIEVGKGGCWLKRRHHQPVAIRPSGVAATDIVILTSAYPDHTHAPTLRVLNKSARIIGLPEAVSVARQFGFHNLIELGTGRSIVLDDQVAITGVRPRFPYGDGSIGLLFECLQTGIRTYFEPHVAQYHHPLLEPSVDVLIAPVERVRLAGVVPLSMDLLETVRLAQRLKARWILATGTTPAASAEFYRAVCGGWTGVWATFEAMTRLHLGDNSGRLLNPGERFRVTPRTALGSAA